MHAFLRKCRGAFGIALTWSATWALVFAGLAIGVGIFDPASVDPGESPLRIAGIGAVFGFVSGLGFAAVLSLAEGRKVLRKLSVGRAAMWGAIGTSAFPLLTGVNDSMVFLVCPIGAALAAGSVALARRGELPAGAEQQKLPG